MAAARGVTVKDVSASPFITAYAQHLKRQGKMNVPKWADYVKTGRGKELGPYDPDWFYIRAASIARRLYVRGSTGVGTFRRLYGHSKNNGSAPEHHCDVSGAVIRACLQELEKIRVVEKDRNGGRRLTSQGQRDLDRIAGQVAGGGSK